MIRPLGYPVNEVNPQVPQAPECFLSWEAVGREMRSVCSRDPKDQAPSPYVARGGARGGDLTGHHLPLNLSHRSGHWASLPRRPKCILANTRFLTVLPSCAPSQTGSS